MKTTTKPMSYEEVMRLPRPEEKKPCKPSKFLHDLVRFLTARDLKDVNFTFSKDIRRAGEGPFLILMNHSSFVDLEIVYKLFSDPFCIITTSDSFLGKYELMRHLGCIPTNKFVTDPGLMANMRYCLEELDTSVLMYPEASYTFDGTATPLPRKMGVFFKLLKVPVLMVKTEGAFLRDPLYNMLQKRKTNVHADVTCLFSREDIKNLSTQEMDRILDETFSFDNFRTQQEKGIKITEGFRADGLNRVLYQCPHCMQEGKMLGKGTKLRCEACGVSYELTEDGYLACENAEGKFTHVPDWYKWERAQVRKALEENTLDMELDCEIGMLIDHKAIYMTGPGHLSITKEGFHLTGGDGKLDFCRGPLASYSLYSDFFWYELGDIICIGTTEELYYTFPKEKDVVAKARLAAEEMFKLAKEK